MKPARTLIVGIGSDSGDDQAGWLTASLLQRQTGLPNAQGVIIRRASVPLDLLDWLEDAEQLMVVDACRSSSPAGTIHRLSREDLRNGCHLQPVNRSTHSFGLAEVLDLAEQTSRLPPNILIYAIDGTNFAPGDLPSTAVEGAVQRAATMIQSELNLSRPDRPVSV